MGASEPYRAGAPTSYGLLSPPLDTPSGLGRL
jgi:hypothetical protein